MASRGGSIWNVETTFRNDWAVAVYMYLIQRLSRDAQVGARALILPLRRARIKQAPDLTIALPIRELNPPNPIKRCMRTPHPTHRFRLFRLRMRGGGGGPIRYEIPHADWGYAVETVSSGK